MSTVMKFGIIGCGARGLHCFGQLLSQREDVKIAAFCDTNQFRMNHAAKTLNIQPNFYGNITEMLKHEQLDAVIITTPDCFHEACAVEALKNGVNVLIDKPLATSVKGCQHIIKTAEEAGKIIMLGFNLRHNAVLKRVKQLVSSGTIGKVFLIENREFYNGGRTYMARWNGHYDISAGLWIHKGSHDFDVYQWLLDFPKPVRVSSFAGMNVFRPENLPFKVKPGVPVGPTCTKCQYKDQCRDYYDLGADREGWNDESAKIDGYYKDSCLYNSDLSVHDNGIAMVEYDNGARASHMECFVTPISDRRYTVIGDRGQIEASLTDRKITVRPRWSKEVVTYDVPDEEGGHGGADPHLLDTFIKVVRGELSNTSTTLHGMMSTAVGQAAEMARREGRVVEIAELFK